ncbi:MAG: hypothetical protein AAF517_07735 [Planctomycetota bacterium]
MKNPTRLYGLGRRLALLLGLGLITQAAICADYQVVGLRHGWNAFHLEIEPLSKDPEANFGSIHGIQSVRAWIPPSSSRQYLESADEEDWKRDGWFVWFPASRPESAVNDLFAVHANTTYLVEIDFPSEPQGMRFEGTRIDRPDVEWSVDSHQLVSFDVDDANPPSFQEFFSSSSAHSLSDGKPREILRLASNGEWQVVDRGELMRRNEPVWVYTEGASDYQGPFSVDLPLGGDGLIYGRDLVEIEVVLRNATDVDSVVEASLDGDSIPLVYREFDAETGETIWKQLSGSFDLPAQTDLPLDIAVRREALSEASVSEGTLHFVDGRGLDITFPVFVENELAPSAGIASTNDPYSGLWAGTVVMNAVSDANPVVADIGFDLQLTGLVPRETLIASGSSWSYDNTASDLGRTWRGLNFDDSSWSSGNSELGFGDGGESTTLPANVQAATTVYFRKSFNVDDPATFDGLRLRLLRDDGAIVYLNGIEIDRSNLPEFSVGFETRALSAVNNADETAYHEVDLPSQGLVAGENVVAVEVHQAGGAKVDLSFDLELIAFRAGSREELLILSGANWSYYDQGAPSANWNSAAIVPGWSTGDAKFGFESEDTTQILSTSEPAYYFRKVFDVTDASRFSGLRVRLKRDDGAVVYLNGQELFRSNMSTSGSIGHTSRPLSIVGGGDEDVFVVMDIPSSSLSNGTNLLAVSVHQSAGELNPPNGTNTPTPAPSNFQFRLIAHVDAVGSASLLEEVILLKQAPTTSNGVETTVLLSDESLISSFEGATLRGGTPVGRRISTSTFDFYAKNATSGEWEDTADLPLTPVGATGFGVPASKIQGTAVLPTMAPTNPFRHKYHPDHDNLDASFQPLPSVNPNDAEGSTSEVARVTRSIELEFLANDPFVNPPGETADPARHPPGWGQAIVGGIYRETVSGLHKNNIVTTGYFRLRRVTDVAELNPTPLTQP